MSREMTFTVFCMESYKQHRNLTGKAVAKLFSDYGVFNYIYEFYDVLHTTGHNYINNDIDIYLKSRGAVMPAWYKDKDVTQLMQTKRQFVEGYIERVAQAVKVFYEADSASADQAQNDLFDLLIEIRNVFDSDMPNIDSAIFLRNGTAIRDANSVLGILKFYLINNEDAQADQSVPAPQVTTGDKIFIIYKIKRDL